MSAIVPNHRKWARRGPRPVVLPLVATGLALITLLLLVTWPPPVIQAGQVIDAHTPKVAPEVAVAIAGHGRARVIITLAEISRPEPDVASGWAQQDAVLARVSGDAFSLVRRYQRLPALAGTLNAEGMALLQNDPYVARIQLDERSSGHLGQSVLALDAHRVHADYGLTGAGQRVAVIDTGIDTDHPDLVASVVAQRCFTDGDCAPHGGDVGDSAEDEHGHGTNVSGIITADGHVSSRGFAPEADIVAIRVLDENNWGWLSDWVAGLDWILTNQDTLQVDVVNMSLGTAVLYEGDCDNVWPIVTRAVTQLAQIGVPVFASTGNQGAAAKMGSPACNRDVIAVGATHDGDLGRQPTSGTYKSWFGGNWPDCYDAHTNLQTVTCFTNGGPLLDLVAPGMWITSTGMGGGRSTYAGTSQASPTSAAIAALLLQADGTLTPSQIQSILQLSGDPIVDAKNGQTVSAVNALAAIEAINLPSLPPQAWLPFVTTE